MAAASELRGLGLWLAHEAARLARLKGTASQAGKGSQFIQACLDGAAAVAKPLSAHLPAANITAAAWEVACTVALVMISISKGAEHCAKAAAVIEAVGVLQSCHACTDGLSLGAGGNMLPAQGSHGTSAPPLPLAMVQEHSAMLNAHGAAAGLSPVPAAASATAAGMHQTANQGRNTRTRRKQHKGSTSASNTGAGIGSAMRTYTSELHVDDMSSMQFREELFCSLLLFQPQGAYVPRGEDPSDKSSEGSNAIALPLLMAVVSAAPAAEMRAVVSLAGVNTVCMQLLRLPRLNQPRAWLLADTPRYPFHAECMDDYDDFMEDIAHDEEREISAVAFVLLELARIAPARPMEHLTTAQGATHGRSKAASKATGSKSGSSRCKGRRGGRGRGNIGLAGPARLGGRALGKGVTADSSSSCGPAGGPASEKA